MPLDKNSHNNKPLLPRVATNVKSPVTPRLAAQHLRASKTRSALVTSPQPETPKFTGRRSPIVKDDNIITPVKALLNSNITPRSSSRKSRIEGGSNQSTPTSTPVQDIAGRGIRVSSGSTVSQAPISSNRRPGSLVLDGPAVGSPLVRATTFGPTSSSAHNSPRDANASFFHANTAKSTEATLRPNKSTTFFYANGVTEEPQRIARAPSPALSSVSTKSNKSQFFHANGQPDLSNAPPLPTSPVINPSPELRPTMVRTNSSTSSAFSIRPPSPQKSNLHLTYRKGVSQILSPKIRNATVLPPVPQEPNSAKRISSTGSASVPTSRSHTRNGSLNSIDTSNSSRKSSIGSLDMQLRQSLHANTSPNNAPGGVRMPPPTSNPLKLDLSSQDLRPPTSNPLNSSPSAASFSLPQSPSHNPGSQSAGTFAEAAANARRERKVLDLEISNSSLLAINRQLEREVRRQKSELGRFRRLSRAGRLSSLGSIMHEVDEEDEEVVDSDGEGAKQMTWSDEEFSDLDEEEDPDSSISDESFTSSHSLSQRQVARLAKDEKRLKVDLERHRQLIVDSQKMNQSLKKCMAWTDQMIEEAKRALNYQVRVSDIKLGGRVLDHDDMTLKAAPDAETPESIEEEEEEEEQPEQRNGLLGTWSPPEGTTPLAALLNATDGLLGLAVNLGEDASNASSEADASAGEGRDSGVHVEDVQHLAKQLEAEEDTLRGTSLHSQLVS